MKIVTSLMRALLVIGALILAAPHGSSAQDAGEPGLKKDQLAQLVAPVALYPDALLSQILMAATYPLEVVQADRWAQKNKLLKGDALAKSLEAQPWDPSVKSLVNFPSILKAMSDKLDQTTKLGDAFLGQQKELMGVVQDLRRQAYSAGNLKTTKEQKVIVENEIIIIQPATTEVIYVPTYSPTVVYGVWAYPSYPPYYYYPPPPPPPPGYPPPQVMHYASGVAVGVAWGYAWGHSNWSSGHVDYNVNQNITINNNINRSKYQNQVNPNNKGTWQHDATHRKGVSYRDSATAQKYNRSSASTAAGSRDAYRGRADQSAQPTGRGGAGQAKGTQSINQGSGTGGKGQTATRPASTGASAFDSMDRGGAARDSSSRGSTSRQSMSSGGYGGGGSRGGGGGRGGGRR